MPETVRLPAGGQSVNGAGLSVIGAGLLTPWVLLVVDRPSADGGSLEFYAREDDDWTLLQSQTTSCAAPAPGTAPGEARLSLIVLAAAGMPDGLALQSGDQRLELDAGDLKRITEDVKAVARRHIA